MVIGKGRTVSELIWIYKNMVSRQVQLPLSHVIL